MRFYTAALFFLGQLLQAMSTTKAQALALGHVAYASKPHRDKAHGVFTTKLFSRPFIKKSGKIVATKFSSDGQPRVEFESEDEAAAHGIEYCRSQNKAQCDALAAFEVAAAAADVAPANAVGAEDAPNEAQAPEAAGEAAAAAEAEAEAGAAVAVGGGKQAGGTRLKKVGTQPRGHWHRFTGISDREKRDKFVQVLLYSAIALHDCSARHCTASHHIRPHHITTLTHHATHMIVNHSTCRSLPYSTTLHASTSSTVTTLIKIETIEDNEIIGVHDDDERLDRRWRIKGSKVNKSGGASGSFYRK
jgi:hypothetical protein